MRKLKFISTIIILLFLSGCKQENLSEINEEIPFTLYGKMYDYGQRINKIELEFPYQVKVENLDLDTFSVLTNNSVEGLNIDNGERKIQNIYLKGHLTKGNTIILELYSRLEDSYAGTLYWNDEKFTNMPMEINYEIKQNKQIGKQSILNFKQLSLETPEIDTFKSGISQSGIVYRDYKPQNIGEKLPLVIWLHGAGEGGGNNFTHIAANEGATAFVTDETQQIFGEAYVLAPQSPDYWMPELKLQDRVIIGKNHTNELVELIKEYISSNNVDESRIYIGGASMGGYQVWETLAHSPELFAAAFPICAAYDVPNEVLDKASRVPTWIVHAKQDDTIPFSYSEKAYNYLKSKNSDTRFTVYEDVYVGNDKFSPHASWVYVLNNQPRINDVNIFEWLSRQIK